MENNTIETINKDNNLRITEQETEVYVADREESVVKKILDTLLSLIIFSNKSEWEKIHERLNAGIVGGHVSPKNCYILGFIEQLKQVAQQNNILFAQYTNNLYIYIGTHWIKLSEDLIKDFLHKATKQMGIPDSYSLSVKFIKDVYEQLFESGFYEKMVQSTITYLNLLNGTLEIDSNGVKLSNHNPKHFLNYQLNFNYDKNKVNQKWLEFLNMVLPDKDTQKTLQQSIGYLFIKFLKLEKAIFLYGTGSNGKSVIFEVIKGILHSSMMSYYSLVNLTNKLGYQVADLNNKQINYGSDASMKNVDPAIFKQLVSGEPIGTRQIREKAFTMTNYAKLIFNVNRLDDADVENTHGFFRRIIIIPFETTITKEQQDKNLHKKLLENKAGILNWIVKGIEDVIKNEEIYLSEKCENFLDNFRKEASPIQLFIEDSGLIKTLESGNEVLDFQEVYERYKEFCKSKGEKILAQRNLNADLQKLGFVRVRRKQGYVWFAKFKL